MPSMSKCGGPVFLAIYTFHACHALPIAFNDITLSWPSIPAVKFAREICFDGPGFQMPASRPVPSPSKRPTPVPVPVPTHRKTTSEPVPKTSTPVAIAKPTTKPVDPKSVPLPVPVGKPTSKPGIPTRLPVPVPPGKPTSKPVPETSAPVPLVKPSSKPDHRTPLPVPTLAKPTSERVPKTSALVPLVKPTNEPVPKTSAPVPLAKPTSKPVSQTQVPLAKPTSEPGPEKTKPKKPTSNPKPQKVAPVPLPPLKLPPLSLPPLLKPGKKPKPDPKKPSPTSEPPKKPTRKPHSPSPSKPVSAPTGKPTTGSKPASTPAKAPPKPSDICTNPSTTAFEFGRRSIFKRAFNRVWRIFVRSGPVFVGFHGTNSNTAKLWMQAGYIVKPDGGGSGADAELGDGLYVSDQKSTATFFALTNAVHNMGSVPSMCAIYAKTQDIWDLTRKLWIPTDLIRNSKARNSYISSILGSRNSANAIRFSVLDTNKNAPAGGATQMLIPISVESQFFAECSDFKDKNPPDNTPKDISYQEKRAEWGITAENEADAQCLLTIATAKPGNQYTWSKLD